MARAKAIFDQRGLRLKKLRLDTSEPRYQYDTSANTMYSDVAVICNVQAAFIASRGCFISEMSRKKIEWPVKANTAFIILTKKWEVSTTLGEWNA